MTLVEFIAAIGMAGADQDDLLVVGSTNGDVTVAGVTRGDMDGTPCLVLAFGPIPAREPASDPSLAR